MSELFAAFSPDRPEPAPEVARKALSVSELTALIRELLEEAFVDVWVCGEVCDCRQHTSGHIYFTLKDEYAQVRCVLWRERAKRVRFQLQDGLQVLVRGQVSVYLRRGEYQLEISEVHPCGIGPLELAFRQLYEKLRQRGWFDPERKRPLPRFPQRIGIVTSPRGAVIRDMLRILARRWPLAEIWVRPVTVQGTTAPQEIADALELFRQLACVDVVIVARGGGSAEDLWAFNEELVAAAIRACSDSGLPVISAVGHEVDWTIADYVADKRAATPSEAAEVVVPDRQESRKQLQELYRRLRQALRARVQVARQHLENLSRRPAFRRPKQKLRQLAQELDEWSDRLQQAFQRYLERQRGQLRTYAGRLQALSPLQVLARGYSLTWKEGAGTLLRDTHELAIGERIVTQLARGRIHSRVETIHHDGEPNP